MDFFCILAGEVHFKLIKKKEKGVSSKQIPEKNLQ